MHKYFRIFGTVTLLAGALAFAGAGHAAAATAQQAGAQSWQATAGHGVATHPGEYFNWQLDRFYPGTITVNVGDSVTWKFDAGNEPHTVTFLGNQPFPDLIPAPPAGAPGGAPGGALPSKVEANPLVFFPQGNGSYDGKTMTSSGQIAANLPGPKTYQVSFPVAGTFEYVCLIHSGVDPQTGKVQGMKATVVVQPAGSAYPKTQAQINSDIAAQQKADDAAAVAAEPVAERGAGVKDTNSDGTSTYHVVTGYTSQDPTAAPLDYLRFAPPDVTIKQGDTVQWTLPNGGFHTVTFGTYPPPFTVEPQPSGPPKAFVNVQALAPAGGPVYSGSGYFSSGVLLAPNAPAGAFPFPQVQTYSLKFTTPGRYPYVCTIHAENGMVAFITVLPTGSLPGMPTTGNRGNDWAPLGVAGSLLLALVGLALRRRKTAEPG